MTELCQFRRILQLFQRHMRRDFGSQSIRRKHSITSLIKYIESLFGANLSRRVCQPSNKFHASKMMQIIFKILNY